MPQLNCEPAEFYQWLVKVRVARQAANDFQNYYWNDQPSLALGLEKRLESIENMGFQQSGIIGRYNMSLISGAQQTYLHPAITQSRVPIAWVGLLSNLALAYFFASILVAILMGMKARNKDRSLITEIMTPQRLPLAAIAWPITAWAYPYGAPIKSLKSALHFASWILASLLSIGAAGVAKAQTNPNKGTKNGKQVSAWVFQSDTRYGVVVSGTGPNPQRQQRITINTPNGWVVEDVAGSNERSWNKVFTTGKRILKQRVLTINILPGFRLTRSKITGRTDESVLLNGQIFANLTLPKKIPVDSVRSANPVIQLERGIAGSDTNRRLSFTWVNQTFAKMRRLNLYLGWETVISKANNRPRYWAAGPLLEWQIPKKSWPRLGIGYIKDKSGTGLVRFRLTETISW